MKLTRYLVENQEKILVNGPKIWEQITSDCKPFLKEFKRTGLAGKWWIWRGASRYHIDTISNPIKPRDNRYPKDMPEQIHHKLDEEFYYKFNWYPRSSGVFTTSRRPTARSYGIPYIFFPIGKYSYLWSSKVDDLYSVVDGSGLTGYDMEVYYDEFELEYEYKEKYGEGSGGGHWEYDGEEVSDGWASREDAGGEVMEDIGEEDYDPLDLEWIPDESFDDYMYRINAERLEEMEGEIKDIINDYTDKNLKGAIKSGHEIMFDCNLYYLVSDDYSLFLKDMIYKGMFQMRLPFKDFDIDLLPGKPKTEWVETKGGKMVKYSG